MRRLWACYTSRGFFSLIPNNPAYPNSSLSKEKANLNDKLEPAIRYLQKLGPEHLPLIFDSARWVIDADHELGLQVFSFSYMESRCGIDSTNWR
jgi:hypothetical protein